MHLRWLLYTRGRKTSQKEMLETAKKLSSLIKMDTDKITDRDKRILGHFTSPKAKDLMKKSSLC